MQFEAEKYARHVVTTMMWDVSRIFSKLLLVIRNSFLQDSVLLPLQGDLEDMPLSTVGRTKTLRRRRGTRPCPACIGWSSFMHFPPRPAPAAVTNQTPTAIFAPHPTATSRMRMASPDHWYSPYRNEERLILLQFLLPLHSWWKIQSRPFVKTTSATRDLCVSRRGWWSLSDLSLQSASTSLFKWKKISLCKSSMVFNDYPNWLFSHSFWFFGHWSDVYNVSFWYAIDVEETDYEGPPIVSSQSIQFEPYTHLWLHNLYWTQLIFDVHFFGFLLATMDVSNTLKDW